MKTLLLITTFLFSAGAFAHEGDKVKNASGDAHLVAIAKGALKANCDNATGKLQANVEVISSCFVDGFITRVTFYKTTPCPPNTYCIQMIETVGSVTLGCDDEVIEVTCGGPVAF